LIDKTKEALKNIIEGASIEAPHLLEHYRVAVEKAFATMILLVDSRFGEKAVVIQQAAVAIEDCPVIVHKDTLDLIYHEARIHVNGLVRGKIISPGSIGDRVSAFYDHGYDAGFEIEDWREFSDHYKIAKGEFTSVNGVPSHGKSSFVDAISVYMAMYHNWRFAVYSPENYPFETHIEKLASLYLGKPFHRGISERMTVAELSQAMTWIDNHFVFVDPDEENISLESVLALCSGEMEKQKIDGVIIDPWNELEFNRPMNISETDYLGKCLSKVRRYARRKNVALWVVAHPTKMPKKENGEGYLVPTPYDLAGSAHWYNKSDNCLCVYRNPDNTVDVHIQKIKFKHRGTIGVAKFSYDRPSGRYSPITVTDSF
jgi:twinkle protein